VDERSYVKQKQGSWKQLSDTIEHVRKLGLGSLPKDQLESLGAQYCGVVSDLAFARSQGASGELIRYLNDLAGRAHGVLYASRSAKASGITAFLFGEFPRLFRATFRYTFVAALIFFLGWGIAAYMIHSDPDVAKSLMPEKISRAGARSEREMDVPDPANMSSYIMTNNIKVGIIAFAGGVTAGVITLLIIFQNGLTIGAVAAIAAPHMGPLRFWSLILPHGVIELTAIFICGGAGLLIGSAFIAPGNLRRTDAIKIASGKAVKLLAGTLAFYVVAGIIEGFITPSVLPAWSKLVFAGLTAVALVLYLGFAGNSETAKYSA